MQFEGERVTANKTERTEKKDKEGETQRADRLSYLLLAIVLLFYINLASMLLSSKPMPTEGKTKKSGDIHTAP